MVESADNMRPLLRLMVVVTGVALLGFAVRDVANLRISASSIIARAPQRLWDALGDATTWRISYKVGATVAMIVCFAILYVSRVSPIRSK
jgi:hypothetical protein